MSASDAALLAVLTKGNDRTKPCKCGGTFRVVAWEKKTKTTIDIRKKFECDKCRKVTSLH